MQQISKSYIRIIFNPKYIFHKQSQSERTCCVSFSFCRNEARSVLSLALAVDRWLAAIFIVRCF